MTEPVRASPLPPPINPGEAPSTTELNVSDHYFWSPSESMRATQPLHECGDKLVSSHDATEFYQVGEGTIVVNDPAQHAPVMPLEPGDESND